MLLVSLLAVVAGLGAEAGLEATDDAAAALDLLALAAAAAITAAVLDDLFKFGADVDDDEEDSSCVMAVEALVCFFLFLPVSSSSLALRFSLLSAL